MHPLKDKDKKQKTIKNYITLIKNSNYLINQKKYLFRELLPHFHQAIKNIKNGKIDHFTHKNFTWKDLYIETGVGEILDQFKSYEDVFLGSSLYYSKHFYKQVEKHFKNYGLKRELENPNAHSLILLDILKMFYKKISKQKK